MTSIQGVSFELDNELKYLKLNINTGEIDSRLDSKSLVNLFNQSKYSSFLLLTEGILSAIALFNEAKNKQQQKLISEIIAERKDAEYRFELSEDLMAAKVFLTALKALLAEAAAANSGETIDGVIAKGLPAKNGRNSRSKSLVPNALERILRPQTMDGDKVDMRNLGEIICVKPGIALVKRLPPTKGRSGFNITGQSLPPEPGKWIALHQGKGTRIHATDENLLIADISGMPKYKDGQMTVDNTFTCKGVNVGSGNVKYGGAVLVNGDVTEKMEIVADGDVTVNGFVESAYIKAGGDIIITQGATGKVDEKLDTYSTKLEAQGNIFIQHGQGLDIVCNGEITLGKQLAYSRLRCGGAVTVGLGNKPNGNLFSCEVKCQGPVIAGKIGAVSGSQVVIDFSEGLNALVEQKETIDELIGQIEDHIGRHRGKIDRIKTRWCPDDLQTKRNDILERFQDEYNLYQWLLFKTNELQQEKSVYTDKIGASAQKRLYPGVTLTINGKTWRADREYQSSTVKYTGHNWSQEVL
jgi:uncharacterized protein (DUF342 family)